MFRKAFDRTSGNSSARSQAEATWLRPRGRRGRRPLDRAATCALESLESRRLLTTMTVTGTAGADVIALSVSGGLVTATVNGSPTSQSDILVTDVVINASDGADTININSNGTDGVTINAGIGNDTINVTPTSKDLNNIGDTITINGDAGTDLAVLSDDNNLASLAFQIVGSQVTRAGGQVFNSGSGLETVEIDAGSGSSTFSFTGAPAMELSLDGNGGGNTIQYHGGNTENILYSPSGAATNTGTVDFGVHTATFVECSDVSVLNVQNLQMISPGGSDKLNVSQPTAINNKVDGNSNGVAIAGLTWGNVASATQLTIGNNDGNVSATNQITVNGTMVGAVRLELFFTSTVLPGTYVNTLTVQGGTWTIDATGVNTRPADVTVTGAATAVTFDGAQTLHRLELSNGASVDLSGGASVNLLTEELAVTAGTGNITLTGSQLVNVDAAGAAGSFSIAAGGVLNKKGVGGMIIQVPQSNGAGAQYVVQAGASQIFSDGGTPASRTLSVLSSADTLLQGTQHLDGVFIASGTTTLGSSGTRVLVTDDVAVNGEGGALDLRDNHMVYDYTGASQLGTVFSLLKGGFANGAWNGIGINSQTAATHPTHSTGLGYAEATELFTSFPATFRGQTVDNTAVLVSYTLYGDVNLDRKVDLTDFTFLAANFNGTGKRWSQADFDYDGKTDLTDFTFLASNFNVTLPGAGAELSAAAAPSVATASLTSSAPAPVTSPFGEALVRTGTDAELTRPIDELLNA